VLLTIELHSAANCVSQYVERGSLTATFATASSSSSSTRPCRLLSTHQGPRLIDTPPPPPEPPAAAAGRRDVVSETAGPLTPLPAAVGGPACCPVSAAAAAAAVGPARCIEVSSCLRSLKLPPERTQVPPAAAAAAGLLLLLLLSAAADLTPAGGRSRL
jgi:hypothetical protein